MITRDVCRTLGQCDSAVGEGLYVCFASKDLLDLWLFQQHSDREDHSVPQGLWSPYVGSIAGAFDGEETIWMSSRDGMP